MYSYLRDTTLAQNRVTPATLCEVGCGAGGVLASLAQTYGDSVRLTGYEVSPQAMALCSPRATPTLKFCLEDIRSVSDHAFDVVMAIDVLEHIDDHYGFLRMLRAKAMHKVFHIPLEISVQTVLRATPLTASRSDYGHLHHFTKDTALDALKTCGYEVVDWFYTPLFLELSKPGWRGRSVKPLVRAFYRCCPDLTVKLLGGFSLMVLAR